MSGKRWFLVGAAAFGGAVVAVGLAIALFVLFGARDDATAEPAIQDTAAANSARAEQIAGEYALGVATIDYRDLDSWVARLKKNTSAELSDKYDRSAPGLRESFLSLQWTSTATPITAKAVSEESGAYRVTVALRITSTNRQYPDPNETGATYTIVVDPRADWKITDVTSNRPLGY